MTISALKALIQEPTAHLEIRRGSQQAAIDYCTKEETRLVGFAPITWGTKKTPGKRNDLSEIGSAMISGTPLKEIVKDPENAAAVIKYSKGLQFLETRVQKANAQNWRALQVYLIFGPTGIGKTRWVYDHYSPDKIYKLFSQKPLWADHYEGEDILLIDDVKDTDWSVKDFLGLLDGYPLQMPVKGGSVWALYTKVVITADHDFIGGITSRDREQLERRVTRKFACETEEDCKNIPLFD